jgi:short-subunit dehydrogenase
MALPAPSAGVPVVVTGASSGIGEAIAVELAGRGHDLVLAARREDRLAALAEDVQERFGVVAEVAVTDLADPQAREAFGDGLAERDLAGLVNNAGVGAFGRFDEADLSLLRRIASLNVAATQELTARVLPRMIARGEGAVLAIASILGHGPVPLNAAYSASKAFTITLSEAIHAELAGTGVSSTVLSPGPVRTDIFGPSGAEALESLGPDVLWQEPEQVARAAADAMERGDRAATPGVVNQLAAAGGRYLPRTLTLPVQAAVGGALPQLRKRLGI